MLPTSILKEHNNVFQKATIDVEDPFQQKQSPHKTSTNQEQSSEIERFNSIFLNINYPFCEVKGSRDPVDQSASSKNGEEMESLTSAATQKKKEKPDNDSESSGSEAADKPKILENNTSENNKPDSLNSEANTLNGTEKYDSKSTQIDSTADDHISTNIKETEDGDDVSVEEVDEDLVVQKDELPVTENGLETKDNSSDFPTSDNNSSNLPSEKSIPDQSNIAPKIAFGDDPGTLSTNTASLNNYTSDENRTLTGNESSKMIPSDDANLNGTDTSVNQNSPLIGTLQYAINSKKAEKTKTVVSKPDNSTLKQNGTPEKDKDIAEVDKIEADDPRHSNRSAADEKSGLSNSNTSLDSTEKKGTAETSKFNTENRDELKGTTPSPVKDEYIPSQETIQSSTSPDSNSLSSSTDKSLKFNDHKSSVSSGSSNENVSSDSNKSDDDEPAPETVQRTALPHTHSASSFTNNLSISDNHKHPASLAHTGKPGPSIENASSNSDKSDEVKPTQAKVQPTASPDSDFSSSSANNPPKFRDHVISTSSAPTGESGLSNENVSLDSNKSDEVKPSQTTVQPTAPPDSTTGKPFKSDDHLPPVNPAPTGKSEPSSKNKSSDSDINVSSFEPAVKNEDVIPVIPTVDPLKGKDERESNSLNNQVGSSAKPSDSLHENENELTPSSQFSDALPKNTNDLSAGWFL